jgi:hypothetical protein
MRDRRFRLLPASSSAGREAAAGLKGEEGRHIWTGWWFVKKPSTPT